MAGGAEAGPAPQDVLEGVEGLVESEAGAVAFGDGRCSVRKAWAAVTRVTWWCQPGQERPSKWSRPKGCCRRLGGGHAWVMAGLLFHPVMARLCMVATAWTA